jgi:phosphate transport system ATP-binding protein
MDARPIDEIFGAVLPKGRHPTKIAIRNLDFFYGKQQALHDVTLDIPEFQVTGIIGPSGCGKSTLLRVLDRIYQLYPSHRATGLVLLDGGNILAADMDVANLRSRIAMVFQEPTAFPMSIYGNIAFGINVHENLSRADTAVRVESALSGAALWAEVKDRLSEPAFSLSGGQQQRLCIARALATRPDVILLDEPTSALDPTSTVKIEALIADLSKTITMIIVTHNMEQAFRCAQRVAFMYLGRMIEAGSSDQIFHAPQQPETRDYIAGRFG